MKLADQNLRAFVDVNVNGETVLNAFVVVVDFRLYLHLAEAVRAVERFQIGHIVFQEGGAVTAVGEKSCCRLDFQP